MAGLKKTNFFSKSLTEVSPKGCPCVGRCSLASERKEYWQLRWLDQSTVASKTKTVSPV